MIAGRLRFADQYCRATARPDAGFNLGLARGSSCAGRGPRSGGQPEATHPGPAWFPEARPSYREAEAVVPLREEAPTRERPTEPAARQGLPREPS